MAGSPPVPEGYDDANRAFLQAFMSRGTLTLTEAQPMLAAILSAAQGGGRGPLDADSITQDTLDEYVRTARDAILPLDYDIRSMAHQRSGERVWALINTQGADPTAADLTTQLATAHSADELAFVKRLLNAMFETYNMPRMEVMCVNEAQALKVARPSRPAGGRPSGGAGESQAAADKGLKHSEVLALLPSLVAEGWLERSRDGFYSLSPRALLELRPWLHASYNSEEAEEGTWQPIKSCVACMDIVTDGERCAEVDCTTRLHSICAEAFWRSQRERKCPTCKRLWDGRHFVGERAVTETEMWRKQRRGGQRSDLVDAILIQHQGDRGDLEAQEEEEN